MAVGAGADDEPRDDSVRRRLAGHDHAPREKTGTSETDANDIGVAWPPDRPPMLVTAYLAENKEDADVRETTLAAVGKLVYDISG